MYIGIYQDIAKVDWGEDTEISLCNQICDRICYIIWGIRNTYAQTEYSDDTMMNYYSSICSMCSMMLQAK